VDATNSIIGIVILGLLWINVPNRYMLMPITLFAAILLSITILLQYFNMEYWTLQAIWGVSSIGLFSAYLLRFRRKSNRNTIDYVKLIAVLTFPFIQMLPPGFPSSDYFPVWSLVVTFFVLVTYVYDRIILNNNDMNGKYIAILIGQSLLILMFLVYALVQRTQAIKQREIAIEAQAQAEENERRALESQMLAQQQMNIAEQNARATQAARAEADKQLKLCEERLRKK
jgi:hypothetical protein